jgi:hypothetical protein
MAGAIHSTGRQDYCTPKYIVDAVRDFYSGVIDLDPSSNPQSIVNAKTNIMLEVPPFAGYEHRELTADGGAITQQWTCRNVQGDGLAEDWAPHKTYVNCPFGTIKGSGINTGTWVNKAHQESRKGAEVVLLIPAAVETVWFQYTIFPYSTGICWLSKRVTFNGMKASIPKPIALVYFGNRPEAFRNTFGSLGRTYNPAAAHAA